MDHAVERLSTRFELDEENTIEALFTSADHFAAEGKLPQFPDDFAGARECGEWLVAAVDAEFIEVTEGFIEAALQEDCAEE